MYKFERVAEDSPDRCQNTGKSGQCPFKIVEGTTWCPRHGGNIVQNNQKKKAANQYRLKIWQERLSEFTESNTVKSVRDEIGILRIVLEQMMNKCESSEDLLIYSQRISDLAVKIEKLVTSCHRLERNMGLLLDKSTALALASQIVEIIATNIDDAEVIDSISCGIIDILSKLGES